VYQNKKIDVNHKKQTVATGNKTGKKEEGHSEMSAAAGGHHLLFL